MLQTRHAPAADSLVLAPGVELARARAHEATGPARTVFALLAAGRLPGPVLWLQSTWSTDRLMGDGIRRFLDPGRLVFGRARTPLEMLWAAEEALRTGRMPLVVVELPIPPASPRFAGCTSPARRGPRARRRAARAPPHPRPRRRARHRDPLALRPRPRLGPRRPPALAAHPRPRPHGPREQTWELRSAGRSGQACGSVDSAARRG